MTPASLQAQALQQALQQQAEARCRALLDAAAGEAAAIRARAHEKAGQQLRRATAELRAAARAGLRQAEAEVESARRQAQTRQARQALDEAWPQLPEALRRRWQEPAARAAWIAALVELARARLHGSTLRVRHPPATEPPAWPGTSLEGVPDPALEAGLVIEADGAWVDGSPAALLADRAQVEAMLRAQLEAGA